MTEWLSHNVHNIDKNELQYILKSITFQCLGIYYNIFYIKTIQMHIKEQHLVIKRFVVMMLKLYTVIIEEKISYSKFEH